ncbi:glycyl radical protein [Christensenella hongkongensis]|uniref:glycyl radical protein n=2 Tax=Christensenella hongkongensis TaxID=270498 RepID=UPI002672EB9E|nr:formate C-acetyltransferase/glycerol dehydratase family glycyl radical enzyme [Christensenella hongkongensis]
MDCTYTKNRILDIEISERIRKLKEKVLAEPRYISTEQACIITDVYQENEDVSVPLKRALSFAASVDNIEIKIYPEEDIVGNRTAGSKAGVIFPESGTAWLREELDTLETRDQDRFSVYGRDYDICRKVIEPYWDDKDTLENVIERKYGDLMKKVGKVVKINQTDHAQGHICPDVEKWLRLGPSGLYQEVRQKMAENPDHNEFYGSLVIVLQAACRFMMRYAELAKKMAEDLEGEDKQRMLDVAEVCDRLSRGGAYSYHSALQSTWFLFVLLQIESNASSFSPGRLDQILYPYYKKDVEAGVSEERILELTEGLWLKFNQLVYLRCYMSARYFAGFPIGFNVAIGGKHLDGTDDSNELSYIFLAAQNHIRLPQPNLSLRAYNESPAELLSVCVDTIAKGGGMPQIFNDEVVVDAMIDKGIDKKDAENYAIVGCVELTTPGNNLGWSDAAMFNVVKVIELTVNNGVCMLTGEQIGPQTGYLTDFKSFEEFENAFQKQIDYFMDIMMEIHAFVDVCHARVLPSAFLSSVISDCIEKGVDVTAGGAHYNFSGIQFIQAANLADSLAVLKQLVFDEKRFSAQQMLDMLRNNFEGYEQERQILINQVPKYGNDIEWVDAIATKWTDYFAEKLDTYTNVRGGRVQMGLYTVSAHVPMGLNVAATPEGRLAKSPLADGGVSAMYGRDKNGPTALINSVARLKHNNASNGSLLNMKFLPSMFDTAEGKSKFIALIRGLVKKKIAHVQINVMDAEELKAAQKEPDQHTNLIVRVAGYTAYFVELADDLQDEIIERTAHGGD